MLRGFVNLLVREEKKRNGSEIISDFSLIEKYFNVLSNERSEFFRSLTALLQLTVFLCLPASQIVYSHRRNYNWCPIYKNIQFYIN